MPVKPRSQGTRCLKRAANTALFLYSGSQDHFWRSDRRRSRWVRFRDRSRACPRRIRGKGRKAEDGRIDEKYRLTELAINSYPERTKHNVRQSGGTIILSLNEKLSGGSALTLSYARHANKPVLHIHNSETGHDPLSHQVRRLKDFIESNAIEVLNLAGPRESNEPGVYRFTLQLLRQYWQQYRS